MRLRSVFARCVTDAMRTSEKLFPGVFCFDNDFAANQLRMWREKRTGFWDVSPKSRAVAVEKVPGTVNLGIEKIAHAADLTAESLASKKNTVPSTRSNTMLGSVCGMLMASKIVSFFEVEFHSLGCTNGTDIREYYWVIHPSCDTDVAVGQEKAVVKSTF